jgi:cobalt-zinc-cadmium efflux system membrane fusion protein
MKLKSYIVLLVIGISCSSKVDSEKTIESKSFKNYTLVLTDVQRKLANIKVDTLSKKTLNNLLQVTGFIDVPPQNLISVSAIIGGYVSDIFVIQGAEVKKGQPLAIIQNVDFITIQQNYLQVLNKLNYLKMDRDRQNELIAKNIGAAKEQQQVNAEYNMILAEYNGLKQKLKILNINLNDLENGAIVDRVVLYAPSDGFVTDVFVNKGKYIGAQDKICEIVDVKHLHAELVVFEKDIYKIRKGQNVIFSIANDDSKKYNAKIFLINKKISADHTVMVHAHLEKTDKQLLPYTYINGYIETESIPVTCLPDDAFVDYENSSYVFVETKISASEYQYQFYEVKRGISSNGFTQVLEPLHEEILKGNVVTKGANVLLSKFINEN